MLRHDYRLFTDVVQIAIGLQEIIPGVANVENRKQEGRYHSENFNP